MMISCSHCCLLYDDTYYFFSFLMYDDHLHYFLPVPESVTGLNVTRRQKGKTENCISIQNKILQCRLMHAQDFLT